MPKADDNQHECAELITSVIEGDLTATQRERLNDLCREDPACRQLYIAEMAVHGMLLWTHDLSTQQEALDESSLFLMEIYEQALVNRVRLDAEAELAKNLKAQADEDQALEQLEALQEEAEPRVIILPKVMVYGGVAAAILLAMVLLWPLIQATGPGAGLVAEVPEARVLKSHNAVWGQSIQADGVLSGTGAWTLENGFAEIAMPSGASVILHGPATFRIIDENTLALDGGRLSADVPKQAKYFTVKTQTMDVVDLGTRFGVTVDPDGTSSACVFEGKVEVHEPAKNGSAAPRIIALTAGQQVHAAPNDKALQAVTAIPPDHGYADRWDAIDRYVRVQGQARFYNSPPKSVRQGDLLDADHMIIFEESTVVLDQPLQAWGQLLSHATPKLVTIPAGHKVVSYFVHFAAGDNSQASATLTFPGRVLGVVAGSEHLNDSNKSLGLGMTRYESYNSSITHSIDPNTQDAFAIGGVQGELITFHLTVADFSDQARVIVEVPDRMGVN